MFLWGVVGLITMRNVTFRFNTAAGIGGDGGGLLISDGICNMSLSDSFIENNAAKGNGGGMAIRHITHSKVLMVNTTFSGNRGGAKSSGGGLQLYNVSSEVSIDGCHFLDNGFAIPGYGGGVNLESMQSQVRITSSTFKNNEAMHGGAIILWGCAGGLVMADVLCDNNTATDDGGALAAYKSTVSVEMVNVKAVANVAQGQGGAIILFNCDLNVTTRNLVVTHNEAKGLGGGVQVQECHGSVVMIDGEVTRNRARSAGGFSIYKLTGALGMRNVLVAHNEVQSFGGGLLLKSSRAAMTLVDVRLLNNTAAWGGGISLQSFAGPSFDLWGGVVEGNHASEGGGIYISLSNGSLVLRNVSLLENIAESQSSGFGGAMYVHQNEMEMTFLGVIAVGNRGRLAAGAVGIRDCSGNVSINSSRFWNNTSGIHAGALQVSGLNGDVVIHNSQFVNNTAETGHSGGVQISSVTGSTSLTGVVSKGNKAKTSGGGLMIYNSRRLLLLGSMFVNNKAESGGGGGASVELAKGSVAVHGSLFANNSAYYGGGLEYRKSLGTLTLKEVAMLNNTAREDGGGLLLVNCNSQVILENGNWTHNRSLRSSGGGISVFGFNGSVLIGSCRIADNSAWSGGGVSVVRVRADFSFNDTVIERNNVDGVGGGILLAQIGRLELIHCRVANNSAELGGGMFVNGSCSAESTCPQISLHDGLLIEGNRASMAGGVMLTHVDPEDLRMWMTVAHNNTAQLLWEDVFMETPGLSIVYGHGAMVVSRSAPEQGLLPLVVNTTIPIANVTLRVEVVNAGPHRAALSVSLQRGDTNVTDLSGVVTFTSLKVVGTPGQYVMRVRRVPTEKEFQVYAKFLDDDEEIIRAQQDFNITIRSCQPGEITPTGTTNCDPCPEGSYTFEVGGTTCKQCPPMATCMGSTSLVPFPGYWHASPASPFVQRCPNKVACQGGRKALTELGALTWSQADNNRTAGYLQYADMQCSEGYAGPLCGQCVTENSQGRRYGSLVAFRCQECMSRSRSVVLLLLGFVLLLVVIFVTVLTTMKDNKQQDWANLRATDMWKVLVIYLQYLAIMGTILVDWPDSVDRLSRGVSYIFTPGGSQIISLDCVLTDMQRDSDSNLPMGMKKWLVYLAAPLASMVVLSLLWLLVWPSHRDLDYPGHRMPLVMYLRPRITVTIMVALHFFYPTLVRIALAMFDCVPVKGLDPATGGVVVTDFWAYDLSITCWSGWHLRVAVPLGVVFALLLCVILPCAVVVLMWRNRTRLSDGRFKAYFGFLYRNYVDSRCFWEGVVYFQTTVLVAFSVLARSLGAFNQLLIFIALLNLLVLLNILFRPYRFTSMFAMHMVGLFCLAYTVNGMLSLLRQDDRMNSELYRNIIGLVLVLVNVIYVLLSLIWTGVLLCSEVDVQRVMRRTVRFLAYYLPIKRPPTNGPPMKDHKKAGDVLV